MVFFEAPILHFVKTAINHYLGPFLTDELTVQQLSFNNGRSSIERVNLNVLKLNEILEEQKLPIEVVEGYVEKIIFFVPLKTLFQDSVSIEVCGLDLSVRPINRTVSNLADASIMVDSMYNSLVTSMSHVKEDCLKAAETEQKPIGHDGRLSLANAIDSIISRIKLAIEDVNIRLESCSSDSPVGIALEIRAKRIEYFDDQLSISNNSKSTECGRDTQSSGGLRGYFSSQPQMTQQPQFIPRSTYKNVTIYGVSFHLEEYSVSRTPSPHLDDLDSSKFYPCVEENFHSARDTMRHPDDDIGLSEKTLHEASPPHRSQEVGPIQIAMLGGKQSIRFRVPQNLIENRTTTDNISSEPRIEVGVTLGVIHVFLTPGQVHALMKLVQGYTGCITAMNTDDSEDKHSARPTFSSRSCEHPIPFSENQPMTESDFARCDLSTSPSGICADPEMDLFQSAICDDRGSHFDPEVASVNSFMSGTVASEVTTTATVGIERHFDPSFALGQSTSAAPHPHHHQGSCAIPKSRHRNERSSNAATVIDLTSFSISLGVVSLTLLHEEPRSSATEEALDPSATAHTKLAENSKGFFQKIGNRFLAADDALEDIRKRLAVICTQDHLSFIGKTVTISSTSKENKRYGTTMFDCRISFKDAELIEVLFEKKNARQSTLLLPNDNEPTFVELLVFANENRRSLSDEPTINISWESQHKPSSRSGRRNRGKVGGHGIQSENRGIQQGRSVTPQTSVLRVTLAPFSSEIDMSLVDRINDLMQPSSRFDLKTQSQGTWEEELKEQFKNLDDDDDSSQISIHVTASSGCVHLRFPIPDLRQDQCRVPWWRRNLRKDFLRLEMTSLAGHTTYSPSDTSAVYELTCTQIIGLYCEPGQDPLPVFRTTDSMSDGNLMDLGHGIDWPRIEIRTSPVATSQLIGDPLDNSSAHLYGPTEDSGESLGDALERDLLSNAKIPGRSPFSHKHTFVSDADKEQTRPGSSKEIEEFILRTSHNTRFSIQMAFPRLWANLHDKDVVTALYNRLACDLAYWTPSAPSLPPTGFGSAGAGANYGGAMRNQQSYLPHFQGTIHCMPIMSDVDDPRCLRFKQEADISDDDDSDNFSSCNNTFASGGASEIRNRVSQSDFCFHITVDSLHLGSMVPIKLPDGSTSKDFSGFVNLDVHKGCLFLVSGFEGDPTLSYMAVQLWKTSLEHNGHVDSSTMGDNPTGVKTFPTIQRVDQNLLSTAFPHSSNATGNQDEPMLSVAMRVVDASLANDNSKALIGEFGRLGISGKRSAPNKSRGPPQKVTTVAIGISAAVLQHRMTPVGEEWITQLMNLADIPDPPICGFQASPSVTTTHVYLDRCFVDYKPLNLQARVLVAFEELYLSTNAVLETDTTVLNLDAQELALYLSNRQSDVFDLLNEYVCILEMGMLRLQLTYSEAKMTKQPRFDLTVSNNVAHLRTCADSSSLFIQLVEYLVTFGDLPPEAALDAAAAVSVSGSSQPLERHLSDEELDAIRENQDEAGDSEELSDKINSQIADALREDSPDLAPEGPRSPVSSQSSDDDFVMVDIPKPGRHMPAAQARLQELHELNSQGAVIHTGGGSSLRFKEDHFTRQTTVSDYDPLNDPTGTPCPVERYTIREFGLVWHLYSGSDFNTSGSERALVAAGITPPTFCDSPKLPRAALTESASISITGSDSSVRFSKSHSQSRSEQSTRLVRKAIGPGTTRSVSFRERGGQGRQLNNSMELAILKLRFRHSVYGENEYNALRQVLSVQEIEIRDRLIDSNVNQFLYLYSSAERPHFDNEPMLLVTLQHVRPELPAQRTQECVLKVALQPLRLNIDQDAVIFLRNYTVLSEHYIQHGVGDRRSLSNSSGSSRRSSISLSSPVGQSPVMQPGGGVTAQGPDTRVGAVRFDEMTEGGGPRSKTRSGDGRSNADDSESSQPIYFREVIIHPTIYIKLDYHGKRLDFGQGTLTAVAAFLAQLNDAELSLKSLHCRTGLLGWQKVFDFVYSEWSNDLTSRQLPNIISGVGPMHAFVQLGSGLRDLLWMPVQRYRSDGRLLHGLQLGARSFSSQTVDALLTLAVQFVSVVHKAAETSYDLMNPGPSLRTRYPRLRRPADIREGVTNAAVALKRGVSAAASDMAAAAKSDEDKGIAGTVGDMLRQVAPTALVPIVVTSEAVHNVVGGVRNQLRPDMKREDERKYKH